MVFAYGKKDLNASASSSPAANWKFNLLTNYIYYSCLKELILCKHKAIPLKIFLA
jgi:hypothetical protein